MPTPIRLTRHPEPEPGSGATGYINLSGDGLNITGRDIRRGRIEVENSYFGTEADSFTVGHKAVIKTYTGWYSTEYEGTQNVLAVIEEWEEQDILVYCNDDRLGRLWDIMAFNETERGAVHGKDKDVVDFTIRLKRRRENGQA